MKDLRLVPPIPEGFQRLARGREAHPGFTWERETTPEGLKNPQPSHPCRGTESKGTPFSPGACVARPGAIGSHPSGMPSQRRRGSGSGIDWVKAVTQGDVDVATPALGLGLGTSHFRFRFRCRLRSRSRSRSGGVRERFHRIEAGGSRPTGLVGWCGVPICNRTSHMRRPVANGGRIGVLFGPFCNLASHMRRADANGQVVGGSRSAGRGDTPPILRADSRVGSGCGWNVGVRAGAGGAGRRRGGGSARGRHRRRSDRFRCRGQEIRCW
jgi:hypothetical protein